VKSVERMLIQPEGIDPSTMMFESLSESAKQPTFTTGEVAKLFFGRSVHWFRWRIRKGDTMLDGVEVEVHRDESTKIRAYSLSDIEKIAHGLASNSAISPTQLIQCLRILRAQGILHDLIY